MKPFRSSRTRLEGRRPLSVDLLAATVLLVLTCLAGGASRPDAATQVIVRLVAIVGIAYSLVRMNRYRWDMVRRPVVFLLLVATFVGSQLVPLPPAVWNAMPGHYPFVKPLAMLGDATWRPLSLSPDLTLNSLLALLPAISAALVFGTIKRTDRPMLVTAFLIIMASGIVLSVVQISAGAAYFYDVTNHGVATGFFANRNHWALLLATTFPLLAVWTSTDLDERRPGQRKVIAISAAALVFALLLITGSRAGLLLGIASCAASTVISGGHPRMWSGLRERSHRTLAAGSILLLLGLLGLLSFSGRDIALRRLINGDAEPELRVTNLHAIFDLCLSYSPTGAGFGTFDRVFRIVEPNAGLSPTYLNHAHNDVLEVIIEGGALSIVLMLFFVGWFMLRSKIVWNALTGSPYRAFGRAATIGILLLMLGSVFDYPLRTPCLSMILVLFAGWLETDATVPDAIVEPLAGRKG